MGVDETTVLLVEDEEALLDIYSRWLTSQFDVKTASSGSQALDILDETVDVVLLDRLMPEMTGDEVLSEIRSRSNSCRVAMVTAVEPDFDIIGMGFDEYLTKPIERETLIDTVTELAERENIADMSRRLYALTRKQSLLQSSKSESELAASDEYASLTDEIKTLRSELDDSLAEIGDTEMVAMVRDLEDDPDDEDETEGDTQ
ncbi:response regulator [Halosegnis longus]|uniref:Response regulator n=1 Tax=Halosegnis longus TaxID=2216012 RepID=A0AAJ4R8K3_9EURY|nr:response regulator [Salella cibi]RNJ26126.1 response regulator [Salella cibi]